MKNTNYIKQLLSGLIIFSILSFVGGEALLHHHEYKPTNTHKVVKTDIHNSVANNCLLCDLLKNFQTYSATLQEYTLDYNYSKYLNIFNLNIVIANRSNPIQGRAPPAIA